MSTRSILRDRRKCLIFLQKKEPDNNNLSKAIDELNFIFKKLEEYDQRTNTKEDN